MKINNLNYQFVNDISENTNNDANLGEKAKGLKEDNSLVDVVGSLNYSLQLPQLNIKRNIEID